MHTNFEREKIYENTVFLLAIILCLYAFSISAYAENEKIINSEFKLVANFAVDNTITDYTTIYIQADRNCVEEVIQSINWEYFDIIDLANK